MAVFGVIGQSACICRVQQTHSHNLPTWRSWTLSLLFNYSEFELAYNMPNS